MKPVPDNSAIRFGAFRLLPLQRQLTRGGVPVPLGARAMDLLLHLTAEAGTIVGKQALMKAVWPGRIVEENNLTVNMTALRRALGTAADGQSPIQTVTGRGYVFVGAVLPDLPEAAAASAVGMSPFASVPQLATRLIGRDAAVADLQGLLRRRRVVSIVGPGGVGKTALALHLADTLAADFPDGIAFVDFSTVSDPERVAEAVAAVLAGGGAGSNSATDRLTAFLRERRALLVLDNCEHMIEPVAMLVNALVAACPGIVVLVTSRESLFVPGEQIFRLQPLPFPEDPNTVTAATALGYGAVGLFVERGAAQGGFALDDANAPIVAAICARLDGIPLALEMAASRLKVLSPAQLAERLVERFRLLGVSGRGTTPRHRTLQAMIDWSYDLLAPDERALLHSLSVFSGGASLAAIQALSIGPGTGDDVELVDRLTALADKSMVTVEPVTPPRFRLLESVRQYAVRKALEAGEASLPARHAAYFADRFAEAAHAWPTSKGREWLAAYAPDVENLRAALAWAFGPGGDPAIGRRLVASTVPLWWELPETPVAEGQRWMSAAAAQIGDDMPPVVRGWLRLGQSWRDFRFSDVENLPAAVEAVAHFRDAGDAEGLGAALWRAGSASLTRETMDRSEAYLVEAERVLRALAPGKWLALALIRLGDLRFRQGRPAPAFANYQEGFTLSRSTDFWIGLVNGGSNMAELMFSTGEAERALDQLEDLRDELPPSRRTPLMSTLAAHLLVAGDTEGMRAAAREVIAQGSAIGLTSSVAWAVESVALLAAQEGRLDIAARLAGYARRVHPSIGTRAGSLKVVVERLQERLAAGLSAESLELGLAEGGRWPLATAAEQARDVLG